MVESGKLTKETCDEPLAHHRDTLDEGAINTLHTVLEILPQTHTCVVRGVCHKQTSPVSKWVFEFFVLLLRSLSSFFLYSHTSHLFILTQHGRMRRLYEPFRSTLMLAIPPVTDRRTSKSTLRRL